MERDHPLALTMLAGIVLVLLGARALGGGAAGATHSGRVPAVIEIRGDGVKSPGVRIFDGPNVDMDEVFRAAGGSQSSGRGSFHTEPGKLESGDLLLVERNPDGTLRATARRMDGKSRVLLGLKLDLNRAGPEDLAALPGMTPEAAAAILGLRRSGPITSLDDLKGLPGLRARQVEKWKPHIEARRP